MSNLTIIIIIFVGIGLWYVLVSKRKNRGRCGASAVFDGGREGSHSPNKKQTKEKENKKKKILDFIKQKGRATNDDVEHLLQVSNASAERYLDELEKEGKLKQEGSTGKSVFYVLER